MDHPADMFLPPKIQQLLEWSKTEFNCMDLNQCLVNWYESNGSIGKHSDDTRQLKPDSEIFSFSFGPAKRTFILEPKNKKNDHLETFHFQLENNTLVIMGGKCQTTQYHYVPKVNDSHQTINVTFRCFK